MPSVGKKWGKVHSNKLLVRMLLIKSFGDPVLLAVSLKYQIFVPFNLAIKIQEYAHIFLGRMDEDFIAALFLSKIRSNLKMAPS